MHEKSLMKQNYLKIEFYSNLTMGDITDAPTCEKSLWIGEYHDLNFKSDTFLLADVFESFGKMYLKMCLKNHLDPNFFQLLN